MDTEFSQTRDFFVLRKLNKPIETAETGSVSAVCLCSERHERSVLSGRAMLQGQIRLRANNTDLG